MSHDTEAAYASSEIAEIIMNKSSSFFGRIGVGGTWSVSAGREGSREWPLADGVIEAENTKGNDIKIAFEYKRPNEGLHGVLTAIGQSLAYLEKGYDAAVMAFPERYSSYTAPGNHVKRIIDSTAPKMPVSVYTYSEPDLSATKPFAGHLKCVRDIDLSSCDKVNRTGKKTLTSGSVSTLWAHMREGMSHPDAFYRYCQAIKIVSSKDNNVKYPDLPSELDSAVQRIAPGKDPYFYLSSTPGNSIADQAWRYVWFTRYFWEGLMPIYSTRKPYTVNNSSTKIIIDKSGNYQKLFSGRSDSIKEKLVKKLNASTLSEDDAWEMYAKKVRKDAHSYREVIDSGLFHIGFLSSDGTLTDLGYKFVDACEKIGTANYGIPFEILRAALLSKGQYGVMLHYIYKLSQEKFDTNFYAFTKVVEKGNRKFDNNSYLMWLNDEFTNVLHLSKKSSLRNGGTRKPFQAELAVLKKMGFVRENNNRIQYRIGSGLEIVWPQVESSMIYFENLK